MELSSFRYGGVKITGLSLIKRDKTAAYQRDVVSHWQRLNVGLAGSYSTHKHNVLTVCTQHHYYTSRFYHSGSCQGRIKTFEVLVHSEK